MSATRRMQRSLSRTTARSATALGIVGGLGGLLVAGPVGAAAAAEAGDPQVLNQETVQVELDPSGELDVARLYSQLTVLGNGRVAVADPTSGKNLRDLDGFSAPLVQDGKAQYSITVDGREDRRTVADFDGELPVTLKASYEIDGETVDAEDLVGKSGRVTTTYTVVNRTAEPTDITYKNGRGEEVTETVSLVTPYVGRLALGLPAQFKNVEAPGSDSGGDGRGGTGLSWTLVLFDPIGEPAQRLTWTADVEDAELPPTTLQVVPVDTGGNRVLDTSRTTIGEGATAASALTAGAYKIDGKVLEVRDGARKIFDGLVKLQDGANALNAGLADTAAPGAQQLADGLGAAREGGVALDGGLAQLLAGGTQLSDGLGSANTGGQQLAGGLKELLAGGSRFVDGLNTAAAGGGKLAEGLKSTTGQPDLSGGAAQIAAGLTGLQGGLTQLSAGVTSLPQNPGVAQLKAGLDAIIAGIGTPTADPSLVNGVAKLRAGLDNVPSASNPRPGVTQGLQQLAAGLGNAKGGVDEVLAGLDAAPSADAPLGGAKQALTTVQALLGCSPLPAPSACAAVSNPAIVNGTPAPILVQQALVGLIDGLGASNGDPGTNNGSAIDGLTDISAGLNGAITSPTAGIPAFLAGIGTTPAPGTLPADVPPTLLGGLYLLQLGMDNPDLVGGRPGLVQGANQVKGGIDLLVNGIVSNLSAALGQPTDGATTLRGGAAALGVGSQTLAEKTAEAATGAAQLRGGLDQLAGGGGQLAAGAGKASAGADALSSGLGQLAAGGTKLKDGLGTAEAGTGKLVDGLVQLDDGGNKLADGLGDAADGSGQIADGVTQVKDGVEQLGDGANRLSGEGTSLLAGSANVAASDNAKKAAMLAAMSEKGAGGALPYGAPDGAVGDAAFSYTLAGANSDAQDNTTRGAAALALLGLGSLTGFAIRRRFTA